MKSGMTISCIGHAVALGCALFALSAQPMEVPPVDSLPVQFISDKDFTQLTQGVKNAPKLKIDMPKPLADKIDAPKAVDQLAPKAADKPAITTDTHKAEQQPKPDTKPDTEAGAEGRPSRRRRNTSRTRSPICSKKDAAKPPPKPDDQSRGTAARMRRNSTPIRSPPCSTSAIRGANSRPTPRSTTWRRSAPSSGAPAAQMSQSEIDALRARISSCWSPPPGIDANSKVYVVLRVLFKPDGSLVQRAGSGRSHRLDARPGAGRQRQARAACCASLSPCCGPSITTNGRTSSLNSILTSCSAADKRIRSS